MKVKEAKDFLVAQTAQQAILEGVPLSELEERMMYFTEDGSLAEDPVQLNEEFEAQYNTAKYEKKISRLMRHAYRRVKKENPEKTLLWNNAIRTLRRSDHYILVLWGHPLSHSSPRDWLVFAVPVLVGALYWVVLALLGPRRDGSSPFDNYIPVPNARVMQVLFLALVVAAIFFPQVILKPVDRCLDIFLDWVAGPKKGDGTTE